MIHSPLLASAPQADMQVLADVLQQLPRHWASSVFALNAANISAKNIFLHMINWFK